MMKLMVLDMYNCEYYSFTSQSITPLLSIKISDIILFTTFMISYIYHYYNSLPMQVDIINSFCIDTIFNYIINNDPVLVIKTSLYITCKRYIDS